MITKKILVTLILFASIIFTNAQSSHNADATAVNQQLILEDEVPQNWFHLDPFADHFKGVSDQKAYKELLKGKKSKTVIVAIIDSGIDIEHEDLKDNIWINSDEIAGNGIDDDKNGYVDDVYGWNFIGGADGKMVNQENLELTRLYVKYKKLYEGKSASDFKGKKLQEFNQYLEYKKAFETKVKEAQQTLQNIEGFAKMLKLADSTMKAELGKDDYTIEDLQNFQTDKQNVNQAKGMLIYAKTNGISPEDMQDGVDYYKEQLEYNLNPDFDARHIVGDDYDNKKQRDYGNNKVEGPDAMHGTHVAGIIGAIRNNNLGMNGIAADVKIMVIRCVPNGDERDKDVANSIYYAVNNGAQIINMSFGKAYSPYKKYVDKAVKYAEKKGVLLVHAAGNDGENNDETPNFPNARYLNGKVAKNWIEVGASSWQNEGNFVAPFSNYGKNSVDVFAPGMKIYSTVPDNKYKNLQGTSMASPVVAGVAALVLSYYPDLTAVQLKEILLKSVENYGDAKVTLPGTKDKTTEFKTLSKTGGIINAYKALKLAEEMSKK